MIHLHDVPEPSIVLKHVSRADLVSVDFWHAVQKFVEIKTTSCIRYAFADINNWLNVAAETAGCGSVILRIMLGN